MSDHSSSPIDWQNAWHSTTKVFFHQRQSPFSNGLLLCDYEEFLCSSLFRTSSHSITPASVYSLSNFVKTLRCTTSQRPSSPTVTGALTLSTGYESLESDARVSAVVIRRRVRVFGKPESFRNFTFKDADLRQPAFQDPLFHGPQRLRHLIIATRLVASLQRTLRLEHVDQVCSL